MMKACVIISLLLHQTLAASNNPAFAYSADRESGAFCVASLIHSDVLLTVASCRGVFTNGAFVGGSNMDGSDGQFHEVEFEAVHPSYDKTADHNVMLVKLKTPSDAVVQPINAEDHEPIDQAELQVLGFNRDSQTAVFPLQEVDVMATKIDQASCSAKYSGHGIYVPEHLLFCSTATSTTCHGNLGSPVIDARGNQVGLVAGGAECNSAVFPILNVRTSAFGRFMLNGICTISGEPFESCSGTMRQSFLAAPTAAPTPEYIRLDSKAIDYKSARTSIEFDEDVPTAGPSLRGSAETFDEETQDNTENFDEETEDSSETFNEEALDDFHEIDFENDEHTLEPSTMAFDDDFDNDEHTIEPSIMASDESEPFGGSEDAVSTDDFETEPEGYQHEDANPDIEVSTDDNGSDEHEDSDVEGSATDESDPPVGADSVNVVVESNLPTEDVDAIEEVDEPSGLEHEDSLVVVHDESPLELGSDQGIVLGDAHEIVDEGHGQMVYSTTTVVVDTTDDQQYLAMDDGEDLSWDDDDGEIQIPLTPDGVAGLGVEVSHHDADPNENASDGDFTEDSATEESTDGSLDDDDSVGEHIGAGDDDNLDGIETTDDTAQVQSTDDFEPSAIRDEPAHPASFGSDEDFNELDENGPTEADVNEDDYWNDDDAWGDDDYWNDDEGMEAIESSASPSLRGST